MNTLLIKIITLISIALFFSIKPVIAAPEPSMVMGPEECGECHKEEVKAWKATHHHKTYRKMPRTKEAKKIKKKMGIKRIKRESDCLSCHFTSIIKAGKPKPIAGISCESCHGPAKEWLDIHNDFGGKDVKAEEETAAHRKTRIAKIDKLNMIRPAHLYKLASNCYKCHTVPNEKLVNVGGHTAGSDFELVAWSQGEIRHNFARSKSNKDNIASAIERKRIMFVVGHAVDLEYSLRGVAKGTTKAKYAVNMAKRVKKALAQLNAIQAKLKLKEIATIIKVGDSASLKLNNEAEIIRVANKVSKATQQFLAKYDGKKLSAIDSLLPKKYKGKAYH